MTEENTKSRRASKVNQMLREKRKSVAKQGDEGKDVAQETSSTESQITLAGNEIKSPKKPAVVRDEDVIRLVLIDEVVEGNNPRTAIDPDEFESLVQSISLNNIQQPILCRFYTDEDRPGIKYQVVAGHRRFQAAIKAGITSIPILARKMNDTEALVAAVTENTNRDGMSARDLISSYDRLVELDVSKKQIVAAIGGNAKTSKIKKIAESPYWRDQVINHGVTIRAAYEGAVRDTKYGNIEYREKTGDPADGPAQASQPASGEGSISDSNSVPTAPSVESTSITPQPSPSPAGKRGRKRKCLIAVFTDEQGVEHQGYVHLSEISFEGETARYIAWYPENGEHRVVSLEQLTFHRGCLK